MEHETLQKEMKKEHYIQLLRQHDIAVASLEIIGEGMDTVACLVNGTFIFRFFKKEDNRRFVPTEQAMLDLLKDRISLEIPSYQYVGKEHEFVGYSIIPGTTLTTDIWNQCSRREQQHLTDQIATCLVQLHTGVQSAEAQTLGVPEVFGIYNNRPDALRSLLAAVETHMPPDVVQFCATMIDQYEAYVASPPDHTVVLHGDLNMGNLAYDDETRQFVGIFDWSDMAIGDVHHDFWGLCDISNPNFLSDIIASYTRQTGNRVDPKKVHTFASITKINTVLRSIQKHGVAGVDSDIQKIYNQMTR